MVFLPRYPTRSVLLTFLAVLYITVSVRTDDQFLCCMKGIKKIRDIDLCPAPCCTGYQEMVVYAAKLSTIVYCEKEQEAELVPQLQVEEADPHVRYVFKRAALRRLERPLNKPE